MLSYRRSACTRLEASRAATGESATEHAGLDGIQRQEGGAACIVIAQQGNGRFGSGFVLYHDVLQRTAQSRFHSHFTARLHL